MSAAPLAAAPEPSPGRAAWLADVAEAKRLGVGVEDLSEIRETQTRYAGRADLPDLVASHVELVKSRRARTSAWQDTEAPAPVPVPTPAAAPASGPWTLLADARARVEAALGDVRPAHGSLLCQGAAERAVTSLAALARGVGDRDLLALVAERTGLPARELGAILAERRKTARRGRGSPATTPGDEAHVDESKRLTDLANARRLVTRFGSNLRFCPALGWLAWDGRRWRFDDPGAVERLAHRVPDLVREEAAAEQNLDRRAELEDHADTSESERSLARLVRLAQSLPGVAVRVDQLDRDPWALNVENGTLDLRTGALRPHAREDLITRLAPVVYDPAARSELWESFLEIVTSRRIDIGVYLQRIAGYCLTGDAQEQCFFLLHGKGSNGKSTFLNALTGLLGDYARHAQFSSFLAKSHDGPRTDLARLRGARAVSAIESPGGRLDEGLVKQLTGGDPITARHLYKDEFEFTPAFKLLLAANERPEIRGTDLGIWRRVKLVPFETTIPAELKDKTLPARLAAQRAGILAWAVGGCLAWQRDGLAEPPEVLAATEAYRKAEDVIGAFLDERCILNETASVGSTALYRAYAAWADEEHMRPLKHKTFSQKIESRPGVRKDLDHHKGARWLGVGLLDLPAAAPNTYTRYVPREE